jgi:hypothetical protein
VTVVLHDDVSKLLLVSYSMSLDPRGGQECTLVEEVINPKLSIAMILPNTN